MRILSVNISQPRKIEHQGKTIDTGIFKAPVQGALRVCTSGVENDAVCDLKNHGGEHKAVYAFSIEHYPYWRESLKKPDLGPGSFGENLTLSSLNEAEVCIGDQLQIGSAVLEVSQPRVPCFKLGIALGHAQAPALFTRHGYTGVYLRVLEEGEIREGDSARVVYRHPAGISVHRLFRAYFDRQFEGRPAVLCAASQLSQLAPEWQQKVSAALRTG